MSNYKFSDTPIFSKVPLFSVLAKVGDPHDLYPKSESLFARYETAKTNYDAEKASISADNLDEERFHENLSKLSAEIAMLEEVLRFLNYDLDN